MEIQDLVGYNEAEHDLIYVGDELRGYVAKVVDEPIRVISRRSFMRRFTLEERTVLRNSEDPVVQDFLYELNIAQSVTLDLPENLDAMNYLVSIGLITEDRIAPILADGTPEEV